MNAYWEKENLQNLCIIGDGNHSSKYPKSTELLSSGIPFIRSTNIVDGKLCKADLLFLSEAKHKELKKGHLKTNDVLLTNRGEIGKVALVSEEFNDSNLNSQIAWLRCKDKITPQYLFYFLQSSFMKAHYEKNKSGTALQQFTIGMIKNVEVSFPPLPEQKKIVAILDEAFAAIDQARANAERNKANARELFDSYLNAIFYDPPSSWEKRQIREVCQIKSGTTVDKELEKVEGEIPYLKVADMNYQGNELEITTSTRFLNKLNTKEHALFPIGTTIFPKRGGAIMTNKKRITSIPICADLNIMGVIPSLKIDSWFLYFFFLTIDMKELGNGSSIPQINNVDINPLFICFPINLNEQKEVVEKLKLLAAKIKDLTLLCQQKIDALDELKQSLLHQAFTGQLTKDFDKTMEVISA